MKKKILLIKFSSIGDVLAFTPVIRRLYNSNFEVYHWVMEDCKVITEYNPMVFKQYLFNYSKFNKLKNIYSLIKNIKQIHNNNYEYIILFHRSNIMKIITLFFKAKYRCGFKTSYISDYLYDVNHSYDTYKNRTLQDLELVKICNPDIREPYESLDFFFPQNFQKQVEIPFKDYIVINPGGGNPISDAKNRLWPLYNYLKLINKLKYNIVILGNGESDFFRCNYIFNNSENLNVINLVNKTSFYEAAIIIKNSKLYIGNDSGLIFLSSALNVLNIGLYGPTPVSSAVPYGNKTVFIKSNYHCSPCYNPKDGIKGKMFTCNNNLCMDEISVDLVFRKINLLLNV